MKNNDSKIKFGDVAYFVIVVIVVSILTSLVLYAFDLVPKNFQNPDRIAESQISTDYWVGDYNLDNENFSSEYKPDWIYIEKIGVNTSVGQPETQDVSVLDNYLTRGAVHYPGSGTVKAGNIFIFGHSTGFRVVQNQAYKAFNDLGKLINGDEIILDANNKKYSYKVTSVKLLDDDQALITFNTSGKYLTLSTCNTFGEKQERWVVEAKFEKEI